MRKDIVLGSEMAVPLCGPRLRDSPRLSELSAEQLRYGRREEEVRREAAAMLAEMFKRQSERWGWDTTDAARAAREQRDIKGVWPPASTKEGFMKKSLRKMPAPRQDGKVQCFMLHETSRWHLQMRRYVTGTVLDCPGPFHYHNALSPVLETITCEPDAEGHYTGLPHDPYWDHDDPRWPSKCEHCPYVFTELDHRQVFPEHVYVDDAGKEYALSTAPPGAMWYADWMGEWAKGPDGHALIVACPDGRHWLIDGPANNCTDPTDRGPYGEHHRCWVRHGTPPHITVSKDGKTCRAGAGSIDTGTYHGFLRNGVFT